MMSRISSCGQQPSRVGINNRVPIEVDLHSLKRFWYLPGGHLRFQLSANYGEEMPQLEEPLEVAAGIRGRLAPGANRVDAEGWVCTKSGWAAVLVNAFTLDDGLEWLELFTAAWGDTADGKIIGGPRSPGPGIGTLDPVPSAFLAYTTTDLNAVPEADRETGWFVDDAVTRYVTERAATWAYTRDSRQFLMREEPDWCVEPIGLDHALAMAHGIRRYTNCRLVTLHQKPLRMRLADFWPQGEAFYQFFDPDLTWRARLGKVRETLTWTPPHTDLGFFRHDHGNAVGWNSYLLPWPRATEADVRYNRPLLKSFVPDVNGIQLLTDAHLARAHDLNDWHIEPLAGGRHLVEAPDLDVWYAQPEPDPQSHRKGTRRLRRNDSHPRAHKGKQPLTR
jgi:hypothetical protein